MPQKRPKRGYVRRRGNSFQVLIYSGVDPVTGKPVYLSESTTDEDKVDEIQTRLQAKVDRQRNAATKATLEYALSEWLEVHEADESTLDRYRELVDRTIAPALGDVPISKIGSRALEKFYAQLRRCRVRCNGRPFIEHRIAGDHECRVLQHRRRPGRPSTKSRAEHDCAAAGCKVVECRLHVCKPLAAGTVGRSISSSAVPLQPPCDGSGSTAILPLMRRSQGRRRHNRDRRHRTKGIALSRRHGSKISPGAC